MGCEPELFDMVNMTGMEEWQQRVVFEAAELEEKLNKLDSFLEDRAPEMVKSEELSVEDCGLLIKQWACMEDYLLILKERIAKILCDCPDSPV